MRRSVLGAIALTTLSCGAAHANLVEGNGFVTDTSTGLQWMDLSATQSVNYNSILADYGGYLTAGWQVANASQVQTLALTYIGSPDQVKCDDNCGQGYPNETDINNFSDPVKVANEAALMILLGPTSVSCGATGAELALYGIYTDVANPQPQTAPYWASEAVFKASINFADPTQDQASWTTYYGYGEGGAKIDSLDVVKPYSRDSTFLVREAPTGAPGPEGWGLFALGLAGVALVRRRAAVSAHT